MIVAVCLSLILNLVLALFLVLRTSGPSEEGSRRITKRLDAQPKGAIGGLPRMSRRVIANPKRECTITSTEMQTRVGTGKASYWQVRNQDDEPFFAIHFPDGGQYGDLMVPVDGYVLDEASGAPLRILDGETFRTQCVPAHVAVRVMGTSPEWPATPGVRHPRVVTLDGQDLSEAQLDALVSEYQLDAQEGVLNGDPHQLGVLVAEKSRRDADASV